MILVNSKKLANGSLKTGAVKNGSKYAVSRQILKAERPLFSLGVN